MKKNPKPGKFRPRKADRKKQGDHKRNKPGKPSRGKQSQPQSRRHPYSKKIQRGSKPSGKPRKESQFTPKLTHSEQNKLEKGKRREESLMAKLIIQEELKKPTPNFQKIKEYLPKIVSRGAKQRLRDQSLRLQRQLDPPKA